MIGAPPPKKAIMICILRILEEHSDAEHTLSQEEIKALLESEYSLKVDRKAVKRNLSDLIDLGYNISFAQNKKRKILNKQTGEYEDSDICSDYYIEREFDDSELLLLLDSVIFSPHIPAGPKKKLIKKIEKLSNKHFRNSAKSIEVVNSVTSQNWDLFNTIELANNAIIKKCRIHFTYNEYGIDKKLHPIEDMTVCPHKIIAHNGHYYLIANEPPFDNFIHYRIDRITDLVLLEKETFPPFQSFDMNKYLHSHPSMFSGQEESIRIIADKSILGDIFDSFGSDVRIRELDNEQRANERSFIHRYDIPIMEFENGPLEITLRSARTDFYHWALQHGDKVEVISPKDLRVQIRETVEIMAKTYLRNNEDKLRKAIAEAERTGELDLRRIDLCDIDTDRIPNDYTGLMLGLNRIHDYSFVKRFKELKYLRISSRVDDFAFLDDLTSLTTLKLKGTGISDLEMIRHLPLKKLYLDEQSVDHMEVVYEMPALEELILSRKLFYSIDRKRLFRSIPI